MHDKSVAAPIFLLPLLCLLSVNEGACFSQSASHSRRDAIALAVNSAFLALAPQIAAADDNVVLSVAER